MPAVRSDAAAVGLLCAGLLAASGAVAQASQVGAVGHARSVTSGAPQLKVSGNRLVNAHGKGVVLHGAASYLAWAWNADFACSAGPGLITSYAGTPTAYGAGYRSHLRRGA